MKNIYRLLICFFISLISFQVCKAQTQLNYSGRVLTIVNNEQYSRFTPANDITKSFYFKTPLDGSSLSIVFVGSTATQRSLSISLFCGLDSSANGLDSSTIPSKYFGIPTTISSFNSNIKNSNGSLTQTFSITNTVPILLTTGTLNCTQIAILISSNAGIVNETFSAKAFFGSIQNQENTYNDPCLNPNIIKISINLNLSGTANTTIVSINSANGIKKVTVCAYQFSTTGTNPSFQFNYGTGANCVTGTVNINTAIITPINTPINSPGFGQLFSTASNNDLCLVLGGTTPTLTGYITVVNN